MEDFDMICRLCLQKSSECNDLISLIKLDFLERIKECVAIEITFTDGLPLSACGFCIQKVQDWFNFKEECLRSNAKLLEWKQNRENLKNVVKLEEELVYEEIENLENIEEETVETQSETVATYTCNICTNVYSTFIDYLDHQLTHNGAPVFKCDQCEEVFNSREDLVCHDKKHIINKSPCPTCGKVIFNNNMRVHRIKHTDKYKCSVCGECFSKNTSLKNHVLLAHTNERNHKCELCEKKFPTKNHLRLHMISHTTERKHRCHFCDYAGKSSASVRSHMMVHSNENYLCHICSRVFRGYRNLYSHVRRTHNEKKKHQCPHCGKKYVEKYLLMEHIRCHTGERPYICQLCNKSFVSTSNLREHLATHRERVCHKCDRCKKTYRTKQGLMRHPCKPVISENLVG